jgi:hypothetical protein
VYSLIQSDIFTFHVGDEKKAFAVHSSAVANTSESFRALVNGGLVEAKERSAELRDVEPDDFVRFLEYTYRRDYSVPSPKTDEYVLAEVEAVAAAAAAAAADADADADAVAAGLGEVPTTETPQDWGQPVEEAVPELDPWSNPQTVVKKKKEKKRDVSAPPPIFDYQRRDYLVDGAPNMLLFKECMPTFNTCVYEDFTTVFLAHARLYTFADMRLVYPLRNLALHKLQNTLMGFELFKERVGDIVRLARYAYDHGADRSEEGVVEDLRHLVVEYMASKVDVIGKHKEFYVLLEEGGEVVTDFWSAVSKYWL